MTKDDSASAIVQKPSRKRKSRAESEPSQKATKRARKSELPADNALASIPVERIVEKPKARAAFRLPPQLDFATIPTDENSQPRESKDSMDLTRLNVSNVLVPQTQSDFLEFLDFEEAVQASLLDKDTPLVTEPSLLMSEPSSADIRARRLAHFSNTTISEARSGSGVSIADAIVLD
jgi:hypothetical protein